MEYALSVVVSDLARRRRNALEKGNTGKYHHKWHRDYALFCVPTAAHALNIFRKPKEQTVLWQCEGIVLLQLFGLPTRHELLELWYSQSLRYHAYLLHSDGKGAYSWKVPGSFERPKKRPWQLAFSAPPTTPLSTGTFQHEPYAFAAAQSLTPALPQPPLVYFNSAEDVIASP